jgi:hypothetical protein
LTPFYENLTLQEFAAVLPIVMVTPFASRF